jgi:hypothetical protein
MKVMTKEIKQGWMVGCIHKTSVHTIWAHVFLKNHMGQYFRNLIDEVNRKRD